MRGHNGSPDPIDTAIAAGTPGEQITMKTHQLRLASGRPVMIAVPDDLTDQEALSLINGVIQIADQARTRRAAARPMVAIARSLPPARG